MSGLANITYNDLVVIVTNWIKTNCVNITNYNGMDACVKNGYNYVVGTSSAGGAYTETASATISSPLTAGVSASVVDSDMNTFLSSINATSMLSNNISADNFLNFFNDLVCFCCTKVCFISSQSNNNANSSVRYIVYWPNNTTFNYKINLVSSSAADYLIKADDAKTLINYLNSLLTQNLRVLQCKYNYTITG